MIYYCFFAFCLLSYFFLKNLNNLMFIVLLLELISFWVIFFYFCNNSGPSVYIMGLILFCVFVLEGVVSLVGLISLVNFSGSDYISSSFLN